MTLREKLIVLRVEAGITQMALAHQLGVSRQAVTRWESGDTTPSMVKLKALAKIYDVSLDWLCSDAADGKSLEEVVEPVEDNGTSNATTSTENDKKRKKRVGVIVLVVSIVILFFVLLVTRKGPASATKTQFNDMGYEMVDIPEQAEPGFDFEWKE